MEEPRIMSRNERASKLKRAVTCVNEITSGDFTGVKIIDKYIDKSLDVVRNLLKERFGIEYMIYTRYNYKEIIILCKWISKYSKRAKSLLRFDDLLNNSEFLIRVEPDTFIKVKTGSKIRESKSNINDVLLLDDKIYDGDMQLYFFGKKSYYYYNQVSHLLNRRRNQLCMYKIYGNKNEAFRSIISDLEPRYLSTIFLEDGITSRIISHINNFIDNKSIYENRGIIYKTGILLYGEPGTGKTSLIKALANKYGYNLIIMDMTTFDDISLDTFCASISSDDKKYIIALEDIDCIIANRDNKDIDKDDKKVVNKLLQFLDSNSSPDDVIFIATTNHIELLDPALLREGRFDIRVHIGGIKEPLARKMCKSFDLDNETTDKVINKIKTELGIDLVNDTIRQSQLQTLILKESGLNLRGEVSEEDDEQV